MKTRMATILVTAVAALAASAAAQEGAAPKAAALPVRKVVLYKHGVGYFEREGPVEGDVTVPLMFKADQMPDVLKSLYAVHPTGRGRIASIVYDSKDPLSKQLADIMVQVPEGNALTAFLMQLKGAPVEVAVGAQSVRGHVMGIEPVQTRGEGGVTQGYRLVILGADGTVRPVDLLQASEVRILDPALQKDLARMMEIYGRARHADRKVVDLRSEGAGPRTLRVGYITETPIWKTTYRLLFEGTEKPLLQGWAIVENRTDEDWGEVELTFVAGSPLSFVMDLYTSYYPRRPVVGVDVGTAGVDLEKLGTTLERQEKSMDRGEGERRAFRGRAGKDAAPAEGAGWAAGAAGATGAPTLGVLLAESLQPAAAGAAAGELFMYVSKGKVSIRRGQAALVPILLESLEGGERCLYYRADVSTYPQHAYLCKNSSALTLEKGPVTVFEGSTCQGESLLPQVLKPAMRAMLPFALETAVEVRSEVQGLEQPVTRATLVRGLLTMTRKPVIETKYVVKEKAGKARVLFVDHPRRDGYACTEPAKPDDEVGGHARIRVEVQASGEKSLLVREERVLEQRVSISNLNFEQIRQLVAAPFLSAGARQAMEGAAAILADLARADAETATLRAEREKLAADHQRIRQTLDTFRQDPSERAHRDKYLQRLVDADQRIDAIDTRSKDLDATRRDLRERLGRALEAFSD